MNPLSLPTWRPTQPTASRWWRAMSSARFPSIVSPNITHAASTSAMRPIATSRSTAVSSGIASTSRAITASRSVSRASSARLRSDGTTSGWSSAHARSACVKRFSPIASRIGTTVVGGRVHAPLSATRIERAISGSLMIHVRSGPMRSATTGPSAAAAIQPAQAVGVEAAQCLPRRSVDPQLGKRCRRAHALTPASSVRSILGPKVQTGPTGRRHLHREVPLPGRRVVIRQQPPPIRCSAPTLEQRTGRRDQPTTRTVSFAPSTVTATSSPSTATSAMRESPAVAYTSGIADHGDAVGEARARARGSPSSRGLERDVVPAVARQHVDAAGAPVVHRDGLGRRDGPRRGRRARRVSARLRLDADVGRRRT